ncbi:MAG: hypothetical protein IT385_12450 [Deltaproteobacteria bacterium]|nr:hypothetical protein [Deltaproteobacteria bacterium]
MRALLLAALLASCTDTRPAATTVDSDDLASPADADTEVFHFPATSPLPLVFFYQDVAPTGNRVRVGSSQDGVTVSSRDAARQGGARGVRGVSRAVTLSRGARLG